MIKNCFRYSIAVSLGHVPALLPYISDSGVLIPERSIFSQLINLAVIVQLVTFYVRCKKQTNFFQLLNQNSQLRFTIISKTSPLFTIKSKWPTYFLVLNYILCEVQKTKPTSFNH